MERFRLNWNLFDLWKQRERNVLKSSRLQRLGGGRVGRQESVPWLNVNQNTAKICAVDHQHGNLDMAVYESDLKLGCGG